MHRDLATRATMLTPRKIARRVLIPTTLGVQGEVTTAQSFIISARRIAQSPGVVSRLVLKEKTLAQGKLDPKRLKRWHEALHRTCDSQSV